MQVGTSGTVFSYFPLAQRPGNVGQGHSPVLPAAAGPSRQATGTLAGASWVDRAESSWQSQRAAVVQKTAEFQAYLQRPAVRIAISQASRTAVGIVLAGSGAWTLNALGVTPALLGVFGGDSGIEKMAASLPWIGAALSTVLESVDIYGAAAMWMLASAFNRCCISKQDDHGIAEQMPSWWALHGALAFALSPLATAGLATTGGWLLLGAAVGSGILSLTATQSLEGRLDAGSDRMPSIYGLTLMMSVMGASLMQGYPAYNVLRRTLSLPVLIGVLQLLYNTVSELAKTVLNASGSVEGLEPLTHSGHFFVEDSAGPQRHKASDTLVRLPSSPERPEGLRSWLSYWQKCVHPKEGTSAKQKAVLWLVGRPHDGRKATAKAIANTLNLPLYELRLKAVTEDERAQELDRVLNGVASMAQHRNKYFIVYVGDLDRLAPRQAGTGRNLLREKWLAALDTRSGRFAGLPIILVVSTATDPTYANLDTATASRGGTPLHLKPWQAEDWRQNFGRLLYARLEQTQKVQRHLSSWWPDGQDNQILGDALEAVVAQAVRERWTMTDGQLLIQRTANGVGVTMCAVEDGQEERREEAFPFAETLRRELLAQCRLEAKNHEELRAEQAQPADEEALAAAPSGSPPAKNPTLGEGDAADHA